PGTQRRGHDHRRRTRPRECRMSRQNGSHAKLTVGGEPRANLLPPEVAQAARARATRRRMTVVTLLVIAVIVAGYAAATLRSMHSQQLLDAENARTLALLEEQAKYVEVRQLTSQLER